MVPTMMPSGKIAEYPLVTMVSPTLSEYMNRNFPQKGFSVIYPVPDQ